MHPQADVVGASMVVTSYCASSDTACGHYGFSLPLSQSGRRQATIDGESAKLAGPSRPDVGRDAAHELLVGLSGPFFLHPSGGGDVNGDGYGVREDPLNVLLKVGEPKTPLLLSTPPYLTVYPVGKMGDT